MKISKQSFQCKRDGMTIQGLAFLPEGENLPIAIVSHGIMVNCETTEKYAAFFAGQGFAAFCFDFNGGCIQGKSDNDTTKMTVFTEMEDLKAVIAYAKGLSFVNGDDITLMGCSQGGFVSALVSAEMKEEITRLILFYPALCIPDDARAGRMISAEFDPENIPEVIQCGPMKLGKAYAQSVLNMDAIAAVRPYEGPVLIVHGAKDAIVDCSYARRAAEAYHNAELVIIPDGEHGFSEEQVQTALAAVERFVKAN